MKRNIMFSLMLILSSISFNTVYSQGFNSIHTPDGVNIFAVGDAGAIFRSTNGGNTWASYTMNTINLRSVYSFDNNVWISGDNGNIYKTLKTNWVVNNYNIGVTNSVKSLHFVNDNLGYLCGDGGIVYKTINGGVNWSVSNTGITNVNLNSISFRDELKGVVAGEIGTVYMTDNGGITWTIENINTTKNLLKAKYFNNGIVISGESGFLTVKEDASPWTPVDTRIITDIRGVTGSNVNNIHVCGGGGFIRNNINGNDRFYNFEANPMIANLVDIFYYNDNLGFAVSSLNKAIIRTTDGGVTWNLTAGATMSYQWQNKLTAGSGIGNNLCQHPTEKNTMFVVYGSTVYVSRNRGESWTNIATVTGGGSAHSFYVSPVDTNVWVVAITGSPDKIKKTTNYGQTWTTSFERNFSNYGQPLEMDQNDPSTFYFAPDNGGFYKSTDNGSTFAEISNNYPFRSPCDIVVMWDSSDVIFVGDGVTGSGQAKIFKSINGGVNWAEVRTIGSSETPSMCNSVFKQNEVYSTEWGGSSWYKSDDFGDTWNVDYTTGFSGWGSGVCFEDPNVILIGNYGPQSAFSYDHGENYTHLSGQSGAGAGILIQDKNFIISMQTGSLFKLNVSYSVLTSVHENIIATQTPSQYNLSQNYPNPFNPVTNIKFELPEEGNISLKVYDQLGKEVETLSDGFKNAGTYEINFDASQLSSGIYFYKLTAGEVTFTKKMILVK